MAKLLQLPEAAIIDGFRGVLDFYVWKGIACVRSWPQNKASGYTPGARLNQARLARSSRLKRFISPAVKVGLDRYRSGGNYVWADVHTAAYFGKLRANDDPLPPPS
ncbi:hypothetical protein LCGC14_2320040 [marine sediment metagenome]|uniref:Uncharacterized protein n=1 Tax=marine sediment metagenome TaxID=412755 RepID=A0A0F9CIM9_9ZZZZ